MSIYPRSALSRTWCTQSYVRYYPSYLDFFTKKISELGAGDVLEKYVFSAAANGNGACMLLRFVGGA